MAVVYKLFYLLPRHGLPLLIGLYWILPLVGAIGVVRRLIARKINPLSSIVFCFYTLIFAYPIWGGFKQGNLELMIVALVFTALILFLHDASWMPAVLIGLAASIKLFPVFYLALLLSRRQYKQFVFGLGVAALSTIVCLWLVCPDIGYSWQHINEGLFGFQKTYVVIRRFDEIGFDHSAFGLIKSLMRHLPPPNIFNWIFRSYLFVAAVGGTVLYFTRIRTLPLVNQFMCLAIACIWLPPVSYDYTLMHLYFPFALLVLLATDMLRQGQSHAKLIPPFICFAILFAPQNEILHHSEGFGGDIKSIVLGVLFFFALRNPFHLQSTPNFGIAAER